MILSPTLISDYPKIAAWIEENLPKVRKKPKIFKAFQKYAGLKENVAERAIKVGNPPTVDWRRLGSENGVFLKKYPNYVFIASAICTKFEIDYGDARMHELVESTVLHEITHWGDYQDGEVDTSQELGKAFEREAYGRDVGRYW